MPTLVTPRIEEIDIQDGELTTAELSRSYFSNTSMRQPLEVIASGGEPYLLHINSLTRRSAVEHLISGAGSDIHGGIFTFAGEVNTSWHTGSITITYIGSA